MRGEMRKGANSKNTSRRPPAASSGFWGICGMMQASRADLPWTSEDMGGMLLHILEAPLNAQIPEEFAPETVNRRLKEWNSGISMTLRDALQDTEAPVEVLRAVKDYAKASMDGCGEGIPPDVARVVYLCVVARSRSLRKPEVSSLSDSDFERMARWCLSQSWIPPAFRSVARDGLAGGLKKEGSEQGIPQ